MPSLHEKRQSATPAQQKSREAAADFVQTVYNDPHNLDQTNRNF